MRQVQGYAWLALAEAEVLLCDRLLLGQWRRWRFDLFGPQCMCQRTTAILKSDVI